MTTRDSHGRATYGSMDHRHLRKWSSIINRQSWRANGAVSVLNSNTMASRQPIECPWMESLLCELNQVSSNPSQSPRFSKSDQSSDWSHSTSHATGITNSKACKADESMEMDATMTTAQQTMHTLVSPVPPDKALVFPPLTRKNGKGLESMDRESLDAYLEPIRKALESLDAESMLHLDRTRSDGALLYESIRVKPIHNEVMPPRQQNGSVVRYVHLTEVPDQYSIGIFIFPPHAKIPLHDHPGMCVLSRVLYGDITRLSLDLLQPQEDLDISMGLEGPEADDYESERSKPWFSLFPSFRTKSSSSSSLSLDVAPQLPEGSKRAYLNASDYLQAPNVTALYPLEGNLHEFVAGPHGAAVLDVLLPPYDGDHGRDCTFYNIRQEVDTVAATRQNGHHSSTTSSTRLCWIIPTGQPEGFHCLSGRYKDLGGGEDDDE